MLLALNWKKASSSLCDAQPNHGDMLAFATSAEIWLFTAALQPLKPRPWFPSPTVFFLPTFFTMQISRHLKIFLCMFPNVTFAFFQWEATEPRQVVGSTILLTCGTPRWFSSKRDAGAGVHAHALRAGAQPPGWGAEETKSPLERREALPGGTEDPGCHDPGTSHHVVCPGSAAWSCSLTELMWWALLVWGGPKGAVFWGANSQILSTNPFHPKQNHMKISEITSTEGSHWTFDVPLLLNFWIVFLTAHFCLRNMGTENSE